MTETAVKNFKIGVTEAKKFEVVEIKDGIHEAILIDLELQVNVDDGKGGKFDQILWNFKVGEKIVQDRSSALINPNTKAYSWIKAILGEAPKIGTDFNPLSIQNSKCQISIKHKDKTHSFNGNNEKLSMPYVSDVFPPK